ncbi:hypothetical protein JRO89_XS12G0005500 [Xanthoceras sorbifolium]|uniref:Disease resistance protein At4g27190-like leucine-rich repeats domain-containing protein n=1 Tax=Xanthoceras sorbifolium TaxID=99658 RepID=A0ABQ8HA72_9ROSI|nr:hypothetical protein JRO89_XS12G0005500 [Xanthoceras sorbifolium]
MEVVTITAGERINSPLFPKLYRLHVKHLPKLTSFCKFAGSSFELPSLARLWIDNCPKMLTFVSNYPHSDMPASMEEYMNAEENLHSHIQPFFDEKVLFPKVEQLALEWNWVVEEMLQGQLSKYSYNLKVLELIRANKQSAICPCCFLYTLPNLERLAVGFGGMENLTLSEFPHLKEVWHSQFPISSFSSLKSLVVDIDCSNLKYIFTPSVALGLVQLQELEVKNCFILEAIIVIEGEMIDNALFPNLNRLDLKHLPKLSRFCNYAGNSIELPSLAKLWIDNCPNMEIFISGCKDADMPASKENLHTNIQPFFGEKLVSDSFCKLEFFELYKCHNVLNVFPSNMLGRLQKLEELWLNNCSSLDEIFELQASSCEKTQAITATQLRKLGLYNLPKLKHVWDMDSQGSIDQPGKFGVGLEVV